MKAVAVFPESQQVKIIEQDVPRLSQPDQVLLRLLDVGICGTDKEICSFEYGTPPPGHDHLVIGHESLAEIVQAGPAVERLRVGDLVVPSVRRPCPRRGCLSCRSGHQDYCYTGEFTERGIKEAHGYMTEYVVDYERYMNLVPPDLREIAVLAEPLTIAEKALAQISWMMQHRPPWLDPQTPSVSHRAYAPRWSRGERGRSSDATAATPSLWVPSSCARRKSAPGSGSGTHPAGVMRAAVGRHHADGMRPSANRGSAGTRGGSDWTLTDLLDDRVFERSGDELADQGLFVALPPWGCHLLTVR